MSCNSNTFRDCPEILIYDLIHKKIRSDSKNPVTGRLAAYMLNKLAVMQKNEQTHKGASTFFSRFRCLDWMVITDIHIMYRNIYHCQTCIRTYLFMRRLFLSVSLLRLTTRTYIRPLQKTQFLIQTDNSERLRQKRNVLGDQTFAKSYLPSRYL